MTAETGTRTLTDADVEAIAEAVAAKLRPPPEFLTKDDLARLLKVSIGTVQRYAGQGMPRVYLGDLPRFDPVACRAWLLQHGSKTGRKGEGTRPAGDAEGPIEGVRRITRKAR